ncbi:MAG: UbiX family flavin prenyltransferase [Proteobacteria bacterium]|nr:UbiX family flavin prenyltransferase [Pseudomonadota bacterium]MBU1686542.1 UbiX family flavin prenyltransferase [Pseudomonadota bacterium]
MKKRIILAITGASGSLLALEFLKIMAEAEVEVHGLISDAGVKVMDIEEGISFAELKNRADRWFDVHDFTAPMASGSARYDGMVILPCSMGTLAAVAGGISVNLIHRAADVTLKERRPLLLAVRETPLNRTHLRNMLTVHDAGATICPPVPSFYHHPKSLIDLATHFCSRLADLLRVETAVDSPRWGGLDQ